MPEKTYKCECGFITTLMLPPVYSTAIICTSCGLSMWRDYLAGAANVNWGGLRPSQGELSPEIQNHIDNIDESRERFLEDHERHEKETSDE